MPNQAHSGIVGDQWHRCDRCGTDNHLSDLVRQEGLLVCRTFDCVDRRTLENDPRQQEINQVLQSGPDAAPNPKLTEGIEYFDEEY